MSILRRRFLLMSASAFAMSRPILGAIPSDVDVAVIGVGMARVAAAQRLQAGGLRAAVSEARTRVCGRGVYRTSKLRRPFQSRLRLDSRRRCQSLYPDRGSFPGKFGRQSVRLFDKYGQMPEMANLRLDAAYGQLQTMIEEFGHANRETP